MRSFMWGAWHRAAHLVSPQERSAVLFLVLSPTSQYAILWCWPLSYLGWPGPETVEEASCGHLPLPAGQPSDHVWALLPLHWEEWKITRCGAFPSTSGRVFVTKGNKLPPSVLQGHLAWPGEAVSFPWLNPCPYSQVLGNQPKGIIITNNFLLWARPCAKAIHHLP